MSSNSGFSTPFILASASPRRFALLASAGLDFDTVPSNYIEDPPNSETPKHYAQKMAAAKAQKVADRYHPVGDLRPVLGADTIVVIENEIIGKPASRTIAEQMLHRLSGRSHQVITGICVIFADGLIHQDQILTEVLFKKLADAEIERYLDTEEWNDKAGAYAVQGSAAYMIRAINGSYTNVVGLPLCQND